MINLLETHAPPCKITQIPSATKLPVKNMSQFSYYSSPTPSTDISPPKTSSGTPPPEYDQQDETDSGGFRHITLCKDIWYLWWSEILSLVTSVAALATMVALLSTYKDQPTSKWNSPISLNGIIAILSVLFKVSLGITLTAGLSHLKWSWFLDKERPLSDMEDFDKASRDPWGCFGFIFKQIRAKDRPVLGLLGALGLLLLVAIEPFAQATVEYYNCPQLSESLIGTAMIPTANFFDPAVKTLSETNSTQMLDMQSQLAIYRGLLNPSPNSSLSITGENIGCVTGNCSFPHDANGTAFTTLAMCSRCTDITDKLNRTKDGDDILFSLPSGAQARIRSRPDPVLAMHIVDLPADSPPLEPEYWPFYTIEAVILRQTDCYLERNTNPLCDNIVGRKPWENPSAASCSLIPCLKTYNATIENGVYSENELSSTYLPRVQAHNYSGQYLYRLVTDAALLDGRWLPCNRTSKYETQENNVEVYASETPQCREHGGKACGTSSTETLWYPKRCVFGAGRSVGGVLRQELHDRLNNKGLESLEDDNSATIQGEPYLSRIYLQDRSGTANVIFKRLMYGLAVELSAQIRTFLLSGSNAVSYTHGDVWRMEICYNVRWWWLAYLCVLLALETAFILSVMVVTWSDGWRSNWKSSALPVFFHHLDGNLCKKSRLRLDRGEMEKVAKKLDVCFVKTESKWRYTIR